jgi:hypothetical protein
MVPASLTNRLRQASKTSYRTSQSGIEPGVIHQWQSPWSSLFGFSPPQGLLGQ